jgi:hypothetical protein
MDIIAKLEAFIQASDNDRDIIRTKEEDALTARLYLLIMEAELKGAQKQTKFIESLLNR